MDEDAVLMAIGEFRSDLRNMSREMGEIKSILKCKGEDCKNCRSEIDNQIGQVKASIAPIKETHTGEAAVKSFFESTLGRCALILGIVSGVISLIVLITPFLGRFI